jgi:hypothetical protein
MDTVFRILGYLSVPLVLIGVAVAIWSSLRARPLRARALVLVAGIGVAFLVVHDLLRGAEVYRPLGWLTAGVGVVLGARWAGRSRLRSAAGEVLAKGEAWYLAIWGLAVVAAQVSALGAFGEDSSLGIYAVYLATGLALGVNMGLWVRVVRVRHRAVVGSAACPHCGSAIETASCGSCGWRVLIPSVAAVG